jgi:hypothetical protein
MDGVRSAMHEIFLQVIGTLPGEAVLHLWEALFAKLPPVRDSVLRRTPGTAYLPGFLFPSLRALVKQYPELLVSVVIEDAAVFTAAMAEFGDLADPQPRNHCFDFLYLTVGDQPAVFFSRAVYADFLRGFANVGYEANPERHATRLMNFMPVNGFDTFSKSKCFARIVRGALVAEENPQLTRFLLDNISEVNSKVIVLEIWEITLLTTCLANHRLSYFCLMSKIIEKVPVSTATIYDRDLQVPLWKKLHENVPPQERITLSHALGTFTSHFLRIHGNSRSMAIWRLKREVLASSYVEAHPINFSELFGWLNAVPWDPEGGDGGFCLIQSFAALSPDLTCKAVQALLASQPSFVGILPDETRAFGPACVAALLRTWIETDSAKAPAAQRIAFRELGAFVRIAVPTKETLDPLCAALCLADIAPIAGELFSVFDMTIKKIVDITTFTPKVVETIVRVDQKSVLKPWTEKVAGLVSEAVARALSGKTPHDIEVALEAVAVAQRFAVRKRPIGQFATPDRLTELAAMFQAEGSARALDLAFLLVQWATT